MAEATLVGNIHGGDSFSDIYGLGRFLNGFLTAWSVILIKGRLALFPQTYGPYRSRLARILARYILRRATPIMARDRLSRDVVRELIGDSTPILLSPDVAFSLPSMMPRAITFDDPDTSSALESPVAPIPAPPALGLNVSGLLYRGGYTRNNMFALKLDYAAFLRETIARFLETHQGDIWLVPHAYAPEWSVESDTHAARELWTSLPLDVRSRVKLITSEYDQHELKAIIGLCDFFVGSRMHACIAALSQGIPCVGLAYSSKFQGVFDTVGMANWVIDGREVATSEAVTRLLHLYSQRETARPSLRAKAQQAEHDLKDLFTDLLLWQTQR